jgi:CubicO group peptidase (beta-lactamase class C family)
MTAAVFLAVACIAPFTSSTHVAATAASEASVAQVVEPLMKRYGIPGMAVGIVVDGREYIYDFGVASMGTRQPVDVDTLFEIGSVTKTFTAALASYAEITGKLSLADDASAYLPELRGSGFDRVTLLELGTHTSGGLPLQLPDEVKSDADAMRYFEHWVPLHEPGTSRTYSNPSIMLLGLIAAKSMGGDFSALVQRTIFAPLGLKHTYLDVPAQAMEHYAQGYTSSDQPIRLTRGPLAAEAYGVRTTAGDLLRFLEANIDATAAGGTLARALAASHTGYFRIGAMTQALMWEQYACPAALDTLLAGNSDRMLFDANPAARIEPPISPGDDVLLDKTGSTNGFAAYVAFVPRERLGVVLLANKSYPIAARVTAAYRILSNAVAGPR